MESIGRYSAAIYRLSQSIFNYKLMELGISSGQYDFFLVISRNEGITQKDICDILYVEKSTTAKAVKNLLDKGYIYREQIQNDKRSFSLYLTEKGKEVSAKVESVFGEILEVFAKDIPEPVIDETTAVLKKVIGNLHEEKSKYLHEIE